MKRTSPPRPGAVRRLVGIEVGVVSAVSNLESLGAYRGAMATVYADAERDRK
jgi:hypothetical protein